MGEWRSIALVDVCDDVQYGVTASASARSPHGPLLLRITDIVPPRIDWRTVPACDLPEQKVKRFELRDGDIVVARTGATVGYAKQIKQPPERAVFASYLVRFRVRDDADPAYIGHVVQSSAYKDYVGAHAGGAAQPNASAKVLGRFLVALPDKSTQRRIAAVLSAFDELIEINERRIELLEDLARSLYREWFVRFRFPGHEEVELLDSELGPIPEGWEVRALSQVAEFSSGNGLTKAAYVPTGYTAFSAAGPDGYLPSFDIEGPGVVLSAVGARCGRTFRASGRWSSISNTIRVLHRSRLCSPAWLFLATSSPDAWPKRGSAQPFISINDARSVQVVVPEYRSTGAFEKAARPTYDLVDQLTVLNTRLAATRDLLLPRLVTGRLDISDIDLGVLTPTETE